MYLRQIVQQATLLIIVSVIVTLWLLMNPQQVLAGGDNLYNIASFACDVGHENKGTLYPNGWPICGTENCPGPPARPPDGCWSQHVRMPAPKTGSEAGVSWNVNDKGRLRLGVDRDHQMIAWTWVWVRAEKTIPLHYGFDSGGFFVNGYLVTDQNNIKLVAGWNLLEFTAYHQHDSSSGGMPDDYDLISKVDYMNSETVDFELKAEPAEFNFVIPQQGCVVPPTQQVAISEIHNANFEWTSTVLSPNWISFTPLGTTPSTATLTIKDFVCTLGVGLHTGTIIVTTNLAGIKKDPLRITVTVEITETPPPPDEPDICLPETAQNFGEVVIGQSNVLPLLINNCGNADLNIHNISSDNSDFIVPVVSGTIAPGKGKSFDVIWPPSAATDETGQLTITSNDPDEQTVFVSLSGTGITIFENVAPQAGVDDPSASNGVIWGDYDNDGNQDIYIVNTGANVLYRNNGNETFSDVTSGAGVGDAGAGVDAAFGDYNNDGFLDIYIVNSSGKNVLYRNRGDGSFENVTDNAGVGDATGDGRAGGFFDCDNDGNLDLFVVNYTGNNVLFHNNGNGTFTGIPLDNGTSGMDVAFGDCDNDGFVDLYIVNDGQANILYHNNGDCSFSDVAVASGVAFSGPGRAACFGDYNNDSYLDLYIVNMGASNVMYRNEGNGLFTDVTGELSVGYSGGGQDVAFGDYNNDGYLDLFFAYRFGGNILYRNNEGQNYTNVTIPAGIAGTDGKSAAFGDYNNDGQLDIYVANSTARNQLFRNRGSGNHWLQVKLNGTVTNRAGIGARVIARVGGLTMMRDVDGGSGHGSQNSLLVHLGLGGATKVDILDIYWPSCRTQTLINVHADQVISIEEPDLEADFSASVTRGPAPLTVQFFDRSSGCPVSWEWDFGDGGTSTEQNPEHTYLHSGTYDVRLTITDRFGQTATEFKDDFINGENMVSIPDAYAPINGELTIPVNITDATGVAHVTMRLTYDQELMQCKNVTLGDFPEFEKPDFNCDTPGSITISLSYAAGLDDGHGGLVNIIFDVKDASCFQHTTLNFDLLELNELRITNYELRIVKLEGD